MHRCVCSRSVWRRRCNSGHLITMITNKHATAGEWHREPPERRAAFLLKAHASTTWRAAHDSGHATPRRAPVASIATYLSPRQYSLNKPLLSHYIAADRSAAAECPPRARLRSFRALGHPQVAMSGPLPSDRGRCLFRAARNILPRYKHPRYLPVAASRGLTTMDSVHFCIGVAWVEQYP